MTDLLSALGLLTVLPVPTQAPKNPGRALAYFPLVGLCIGLVLALSKLLLRLAVPELVAAALIVFIWAVLTGGLHLDGFADSCDGLFAATSRERRLEILRDVHVGAFGVTGLVLLLVVKVAAVANASTPAVLLAPILGRWAMVYAAAFPLARHEGMAAMFAGGLTRREILLATATAALAAAPFGMFGLTTLITAVLTATIIARLATTRLGGLTGDIYGMVCETVEASVLIIASAQK